MVRVSVADHSADPVDRAVRRLDQELGPAVGVEVVQLGLGVVGTGADVHPQVDAPQLVPVELISVEVHVPGGAWAGVVLRVARVPLDDQLELSVAVDIRREGVVGAVAVLGAVDGDEVRRFVQRHVEMALRPGGEGLAHPHQVLPTGAAGDRLPARAAALERDPVGRLGGPLRIQQVRRIGDRLGRDPCAVSEDDESGIERLIPQQTPGHQDALVRGDGDGAAVQPFRIALESAARWSGLGGRRSTTGGEARAGERERQSQQQCGGTTPQSCAAGGSSACRGVRRHVCSVSGRGTATYCGSDRWGQPFTEPIITPLAKCFWRNG